jgi:protein gp37
MADEKRISKGLYWDRSWRVVNGCTKISPSCDHCWSESETNVRGSNPAVASRYAKDEVLTVGKWNGRISLATERVLTEPLRIKKPQVWAIWNDLFHEDMKEEWITEVIDSIVLAHWHTFMVLTKRPERMKSYFSDTHSGRWHSWPEPHPNLWLGVTAENQEMADQRIPILLQTPAAKRFVSVEPCLSEINLGSAKGLPVYWMDRGTPIRDGLSQRKIGEVQESRWYRHDGNLHPWLDWVIVGGESGPGARPMHEEWARDIVRQCRAAGVPAFVKQLHRLTPSGRIRVSKDMNEWPEDLRVREFPENHSSFSEYESRRS